MNESTLYYGYAHYKDGTAMCHCVGTSEELDESEQRVLSRMSGRMSATFTRKEVEREFVLAHA